MFYCLSSHPHCGKHMFCGASSIPCSPAQTCVVRTHSHTIHTHTLNPITIHDFTASPAVIFRRYIQLNCKRIFVRSSWNPSSDFSAPATREHSFTPNNYLQLSKHRSAGARHRPETIVCQSSRKIIVNSNVANTDRLRTRARARKYPRSRKTVTSNPRSHCAQTTQHNMLHISAFVDPILALHRADSHRSGQRPALALCRANVTREMPAQ